MSPSIGSPIPATEVTPPTLVPLPKRSFAALQVPAFLQHTLRSLAITEPTPIQSLIIPPLLSGSSVIGISPTGSGKTISFALPIISTWSKDPFGIYALVLTPTRELAVQIAEQFMAVGNAQNLKVTLVVGGMDMRQQALELQRRPHVVIATPGRLADHIKTSGEDTIAGLRKVKTVILDEADRLLTDTFADHLECCLGVLPEDKQTGLFTATVTDEIKELSKNKDKQGRDIVMCDVGSFENVTIPPKLDQRYLLIPQATKESYLHALLLSRPDTSVIIFVNRTATAAIITRLLRLLEHRVTTLHSQLPQRERLASLSKFRAQAARILVATDVASRGLDIPEVGMVINYDVPRNPDDYVHRVGRTARAGRKGVSCTFITQFDVALVSAIEERTDKKMVEWDEQKELEGRIVKELLPIVTEKKREARMDIDEGKDEVGTRRKKLRERVERKKGRRS